MTTAHLTETQQKILDQALQIFKERDFDIIKTSPVLAVDCKGNKSDELLIEKIESLGLYYVDSDDDDLTDALVFDFVPSIPKLEKQIIRRPLIEWVQSVGSFLAVGWIGGDIYNSRSPSHSLTEMINGPMGTGSILFFIFYLCIIAASLMAVLWLLRWKVTFDKDGMQICSFMGSRYVNYIDIKGVSVTDDGFWKLFNRGEGKCLTITVRNHEAVRMRRLDEFFADNLRKNIRARMIDPER